jgi:hypothetical protein
LDIPAGFGGAALSRGVRGNLALIVLLVVCLAAAMLLTSGCRDRPAQGDSAPGLEGQSATPIPLPSGWKRFEEGAFAGAVPEEWYVAFLDASDYLGTSRRIAEVADPGQREILAAVLAWMLRDGGPREVFVVVVDTSPVFPTNINVLGCFPATEMPPPGQATQLLQSRGFRAESYGTVRFGGRDLELVRAHEGLPSLSPRDTYQVYPSIGSCALVVTLTTRAGETDALPSFKTFVELLQVNTEQLSR